MSLTRRSLLGVAAGLVAAACRPGHHRRTPTAGADDAALRSALAAEHALLTDYDQAIAALDAVAATRLSAARRRHAAHVEALQKALGTPSPTASPASTTAPAATSLPSVLRASATSLGVAAVGAADGRAAALLASIAAEHAGDAATTREPA